jgi:hypothetical protein
MCGATLGHGWRVRFLVLFLGLDSYVVGDGWPWDVYIKT